MSNGRDIVALSSALRSAVSQNNIQATENLLKLDVPQIADEKEGNTPLHLAAKAENSEMVALLLKYNADRGVKNKNGHTPIQLTRLGKVILEFTKYATDTRDSYEYSSRLISLVRDIEYNTATALLKAGAKPDQYTLDRDDSSALHIAIDKPSTPDNLKFIKTLLDHQADRAHLRKINPKKTLTPIELASRESKWSVVKLFAEYPTNENDSYRYGSALLDAAKNNESKVVIDLLKAGSAAYGMFHLSCFYTSLHWTVKHKNLPLFKTLLEYGANPYNTVKNDGSTKFFSACEFATSVGQFDFVAACAEYKIAKTLPGLLAACIAELTSYSKKWGTRHSSRAIPLIKDLNALLETKKISKSIQSLEPEKILAIFTSANDAFTSNKTIISNTGAPYYAQPPKSYVEDEYNVIIKKYAQKLEKFAQREKKEEIFNPVKLEHALTIDSDNIIKFDSKSSDESKALSTTQDMQELSTIKPSFVTLMKSNSFYSKKLLEIQSRQDPEQVQEDDALATLKGLKVLP